MSCLNGVEDCEIHSTDEVAARNADVFPFNQSGSVIYPVFALETRKDMRQNVGEPDVYEPLLRRYEKITGHRVRASDGSMKHVDDSLAEREIRKIQHLSMSTRRWLPGKNVPVPFVRLTFIEWKNGVAASCPAKDRPRHERSFRKNVRQSTRMACRV